MISFLAALPAFIQALPELLQFLVKMMGLIERVSKLVKEREINQWLAQVETQVDLLEKAATPEEKKRVATAVSSLFTRLIT